MHVIDVLPKHHREPPRITLAWCIIVLLAGGSLLPTLLVEIPAMLDYPNHLARMHLLADRGTPNENPYYEISFALYPNLAMDLIVPQLAKLLSVQSSVWLFFFLAQLLVISGAIALELATKGRHEMAVFGALLCLHSMPFSLGLVNFEFGLGVALWGVAAWIAFESKKWLRFAIHSSFVCALFVSHLFALGVYGLTVGLYEISRIWRHRLKLSAAAMDFSIIAAPVFVMLAILHKTGGALGGTENEWVLSWKPQWVAFFLNGYNVALSAGSMTALIVVLCHLAVKRRLKISPAGYWIGFGFLIAFIAMPFKLFDSRMADIRMIAAAFLILPAFVTVRRGNPDAIIAVIVVSVLIVLNGSYVAHVWLSYRSEYAAIKASFALLPPASFILVGNSRTEVSETLLTDAPMYRAPVLAVHYAKAFVSSLYTVAGLQPVEVRLDLKHLDVSAATESYAPPSLTTLRELARGQHVVDAPGYLRNWTHDFEFLYLVGPRVDNALPDVLDELAGNDRFTLYAVRRSHVLTNASNAAGLP